MRQEMKETLTRMAKSAGRGAIAGGIAMAVGEPPSGAILVGLGITILDCFGRPVTSEPLQLNLERVASGIGRKRRPRRRRERS